MAIKKNNKSTDEKQNKTNTADNKTLLGVKNAAVTKEQLKEPVKKSNDDLAARYELSGLTKGELRLIKENLKARTSLKLNQYIINWLREEGLLDNQNQS